MKVFHIFMFSSLIVFLVMLVAPVVEYMYISQLCARSLLPTPGMQTVVIGDYVCGRNIGGEQTTKGTEI